jgi:hypothetical protein
MRRCENRVPVCRLGFGIAFFRDRRKHSAYGQYVQKTLIERSFIPAPRSSAAKGGGSAHRPEVYGTFRPVTFKNGKSKRQGRPRRKGPVFFALFSVYECLRAGIICFL